jgi:hypothetical protein
MLLWSSAAHPTNGRADLQIFDGCSKVYWIGSAKARQFPCLLQRIGASTVQIPGKSQQHYDLLAIALVVAYFALAASAARGLLGGSALDATWAGVQRRDELRVVVDAGFRPFSWMRDEQVIGLDADLARAIAARLGVRVRFVVTGYDALYDALARDEADLIASALPYTPETSWRARYSHFYFNGGQVLLTRNDAALAPGASLAGLRVGALLGTDSDTLLRRQERQGVAKRCCCATSSAACSTPWCSTMQAR